MNTQEKITFVDNFMGAVRAELVAKIESGKVPEQWDGFELRQWLTDTFTRETYPMVPRRFREYRNARAVGEV